jgi:acetate---CoA ligase (ADP-forming)
LAQVAGHSALLRKKIPHRKIEKHSLPAGTARFMNEAESLSLLAGVGLPIIEHQVCKTESDALRAHKKFGSAVMKVCSPEIPHKSDHGLVALDVPDAAAEFRRQREQCIAMGARFDGVIVARKAQKGREMALGARLDPQFGPVVLVGDGGIFLEALKDFRLLLPPFTEEEVLLKLQELRAGPLLGALRGVPARDTAAFAGMAVRLGDAMLGWGDQVASVDINPVMVFETGRGALALDALVERNSS